MKIGIDFGGTNTRVGLVDNGNIVNLISEPTLSQESEKKILDHLIDIIRRVITPDVTGIGIGVPSVVDADKGIVYNVANIPSWKEVHLKKILEDEFQVPVVVNNDCNCFALGEHAFGEAQGYKDAVCMTIGTGVGSGLIINGKLYGGSNTGAGEIGSIPYLEHDFEHYCSSQFFAKEHNVTGKEIYEKAVKGDADAIELMNEFGGHLGNLINTILYVYDPQIIVMGGSIALSYELFSKAMYGKLDEFLYPETVKRLKISLSTKDNIGLLGASSLV